MEILVKDIEKRSGEKLKEPYIVYMIETRFELMIVYNFFSFCCTEFLVLQSFDTQYSNCLHHSLDVVSKKTLTSLISQVFARSKWIGDKCVVY